MNVVWKIGKYVATAGLIGCATMAYAHDWKIDLVDQSGIGMYSTMKVDKAGNVHLAYVVDDGRYTLKYGFWDHALKRWFVMPVASDASFCSMTLDSKQHPHISWADNGTISGTKLRYAHWDGSSWKTQAIPLNSDIIAYYTSIALDNDDNPSISFYEYRGPKGSEISVRMRVVTWEGRFWQVRTVDGENQSGKFNAIASDSHGHLHLAYANVGGMTAGMRYAFWDGKMWTREILEGLRENNGLYVGYSCNVAVDKEGNPHLTYINDSNGTVKYAVRKDGRWQIQAMGRVSKVAYPDRNAIALDEEGRPYVGYFDVGRGTLTVSHPEGTRWTAEVLDGNGAGFASSIVLDRDTIWVSYGDPANNGLKVARAELADRKSSNAAAAAKTGKETATPEKRP